MGSIRFYNWPWPDQFGNFLKSGPPCKYHIIPMLVFIHPCMHNVFNCRRAGAAQPSTWQKPAQQHWHCSVLSARSVAFIGAPLRRHRRDQGCVRCIHKRAMRTSEIGYRKVHSMRLASDWCVGGKKWWSDHGSQMFGNGPLMMQHRSQTLGPEILSLTLCTWIPDPESMILGSAHWSSALFDRCIILHWSRNDVDGLWIPDHEFWFSNHGPGVWILNPGSCIRDPGFWVLNPGAWARINVFGFPDAPFFVNCSTCRRIFIRLSRMHMHCMWENQHSQAHPVENKSMHQAQLRIAVRSWKRRRPAETGLVSSVNKLGHSCILL